MGSLQVAQVLGRGHGYFKLAPSPLTVMVDPSSGSLQDMPLQVGGWEGPEGGRSWHEMRVGSARIVCVGGPLLRAV